MIKNIDRFLQLKTAHGAFVELPVQDDRLEKLGELAILAIVVEILSLVFIANAHSPLPSLTDINGENVFALVSLVQIQRCCSHSIHSLCILRQPSLANILSGRHCLQMPIWWVVQAPGCT